MPSGLPFRIEPSTPTPSRSASRSEEHTSELQSQSNLVCRLLLEKKKKTYMPSLVTLNRYANRTSNEFVRCTTMAVQRCMYCPERSNLLSHDATTSAITRRNTHQN